MDYSKIVKWIKIFGIFTLIITGGSLVADGQPLAIIGILMGTLGFAL